MASRICPQCGQEAPQTARFCSQCSAPFVGDPTRPFPTQPTAIDTAAKGSKVVLFTVLGVAAVLIIIVVVLLVVKANSVVSATPPVSTPAPPVVQAPAPTPVAPPVVQAPPTLAAAPPVTQAPGPAVAPAAIVAYLAYVQQAEAYRVNLENSQTAALLPLLGTAQGMKEDTGDDDNGNGGAASTKPTGANQINQGMTENLQKWQNLVKTFQATTPPAGCETLADDYYKFLSDYTNVCSQIQVAIANGDYAKVVGLQTAQTVVDQDASNADAALAAVCTKYNAQKLFTISTGSGGSGTSLLGG